ncbi:MAG: hypothetical protein ABI718_04140 [Acidobacteriota bacterium]
MKKLALLLSVLLLAACATPGPPVRPNDREWNALVSEYQNLQSLRASAPQPPAGATRKQQIELLLANDRKIQPLYDPFMARIVEYLDRTGDPRAAHVVATEKIRIGDEYLNVLSHFDKAVNSYQAALDLDPTNEDARARLSRAQKLRFVSMEQFSTVNDGMKEDRVRAAVGMPREDWIKQVVQRNRVYTVWIFPKQDGGAAAIYFQDGVVYHTNWNAAPPRTDAK